MSVNIKKDVKRKVERKMEHKTESTEARQECFKLFLDHNELFHMISPEQVGKLIRAILKYGSNGTMPELDDELTMYFLMMKGQIDQDAERYENRCRQNSINAKKRYTSKIPVLEDVKTYFMEQSLQSDPEYFFDYYQARGWCANNNQILDWKALARTWEKNDKQKGKKFDDLPATLEYIDVEGIE